jgi:hypothetical protein
MPFLELLDETLDINSTENYELSVQVSPEEFEYCLFDTIRNKFILMRVFEPGENKIFTAENINELISNDDFLTRRYKKVNVVMPSRKFTIIPAPLYDPGKIDEYFTFNQNPDENNIIISNKLSDPDSFVVYSVSNQIINVIKNHYPDIQVMHHLKPLFNHISNHRKNVHGNYIHIHKEGDYFNLIIFSHNTLIFCNTFNYRNITDILYYALNVFKTLDLKQDETIWFSGQTEKQNELSNVFSAYVRNVKFAEPSGNFTFSYVFDETNLHSYINLFNAINCG